MICSPDQGVFKPVYSKLGGLESVVQIFDTLQSSYEAFSNRFDATVDMT